jgi:hypothetical protein
MTIRHFTTWAGVLMLFGATAAAQAPAGQPGGGQTPAAQTPAAQAPAAQDSGAQSAGLGTTTAPTFELTGGYQFLRAGEDLNFPFGLNVDAAWSYRSNLSLVGEIGWAFKTEDSVLVDDDINLHEWTFGVGPRWNGRGDGRAWPFAQVLVGAAVARATGAVGGLDLSETQTHFMVQPGVGVNILAGDGWGVVGQVDYRRIFVGDDDDDDLDDEDGDDDGGDGENQFRVFIGIRMILD